MARIVEYNTVLQTLLEQGLQSLYYNSGSFGFPPGVVTHTVGWVARPDPTIRADALLMTRQVPEPCRKTLVELTLRAWTGRMPGVVWAMPRSHWAYELDFGSRDWMPGLLRAVEIDPEALAPLTNGAAIEFGAGHAEEFASFLGGLIDNLSGSSDFQLVWPGQPVVCTVHHHQQLWWTTSHDAVYRAIEQLPVK